MLHISWFIQPKLNIMPQKFQMNGVVVLFMSRTTFSEAFIYAAKCGSFKTKRQFIFSKQPTHSLINTHLGFELSLFPKKLDGKLSRTTFVSSTEINLKEYITVNISIIVIFYVYIGFSKICYGKYLDVLNNLLLNKSGDMQPQYTLSGYKYNYLDIFS